MEESSTLNDGEAAIRLRSKFPFEDIEYFGFSSAIVAINGLFKAMLQSDHAYIRAEMAVGQTKTWPAIEAEIGFPVRFEAAETALVTTPVTQVIAVLEGAPFLTVSLSDAAAESGYSERGLRRQLERSGTSYRKLVEQVREQRARNLLSGSI